jgi:Flp pilus assembly protein TadG
MAPNTVVPPQNSSGWTVFPTITKTPYVDSAALESQSPDDGKVVSAGEDFQVNWVIKNTGKRPWNSGFYFKPLVSTLYPSPSGNQYVSGSVATGDTYDFSTTVEAPSEEGIHVIKYVLMNDAGVGFFQFYFSIQVQP